MTYHYAMFVLVEYDQVILLFDFSLYINKYINKSIKYSRRERDCERV